MPYDGLFHFYLRSARVAIYDGKSVSMPYDGLFHFYMGIGYNAHLIFRVSMPYDGLFHFYTTRKSVGRTVDGGVSMPYDGLFHFYGFNPGQLH